MREISPWPCEPSMNPTFLDNCFGIISRKFLCGIPLAELGLEAVLDALCDKDSGVLHQDALLSHTVYHPLILKYPIKSDYQRMFLRTLIQKLELVGAEISDRIFERHCELLGTVADDLSYWHYCLDDCGNAISLKESINLVCNGTTGLRTWEASHFLINWCCDNASSLKGTNILELGSGIGLCGIAISLLCKPSLYCFSDCHAGVLETLTENITLNTKCSPCLKQNLLRSLEERTHWTGNIKDSNVAVLNLPWEDIPSCDFSLFSPKYILASDIIYDTSVFHALASALIKLAQGGAQIILASTERNPETLTEFMKLMCISGLQVKEEIEPKLSILPRTKSAAIVRIHRITSENPSASKKQAFV